MIRIRRRPVPVSDPPPDELPDGSPIESLEAALGMIPARQKLALPRWLAPLAICAIVGMLPWIIYLGLTLPGKARADHYNLAWIGFDCLEWSVLAALAFFAIRRHPATGPVAAIASAMLVIDAWFDVVTTHNGGEFLVSVLLAAFAEIPLAIICAWAAINAERIRARAYRNLRVRWQRAIDVARAADARATDARATAAVVLAATKVSPPALRP
jgi:hypothetical protein